MNATEDGTEASEAPPPRPELGAGFQWLALAGLLIGPLLGVVAGPRLVPDRPLFEARVPWEGAVPTPDHWSHPPRPGESATLVAEGARPVLAARARTPAAAEALAIELTMARLSRSPELAGRREAGRARWSESMLHGPSALLSPAASCVALLRGWSMAWRAVVAPAESSAPAGEALGPAPASGEGARASGPAPAEARGARRAGRGSAAGAIPPMPEIARLALASDAAGLEGALHREARVARGMLFARIGALPDARRTAAAEVWRGAWSTRAADLDTIATAIEARLPRIERELIATAAASHALAAEPAIPDPGVIALLSATLPPAGARPLWATWGVFAAAGAILACLIAVPLGWAAARARAARRAALMQQLEQEAVAALAATPWAPSAAVEARLQVVTGPRPRRVASVVRELVAHFLTDGERVLVVDAGRNFRLHDSFGGRARLGFQECMREQLPLLGVGGIL